MFTNADVLTKDKLLELKELIASQKPDIISISEVKPKNISRTITNLEYQLPGYNLESDGLIGDNASRGNIVYIHQSLQYNRIKIDRFTNQSLPNITDFIACEIKLDRGEKMLFCSVYRSPNSTKEYSKQINDTMRQLCDQGQTYRHIIFVGDYNYPMIDWETGTTSSSLEDINFLFLEATRDCFLTQHVTSPTRGRGSTKPSLLDLVLTNTEDAIEYLNVEAPLGRSDHATIYFGYRCQPEPVDDKIRYMYDKADYNKMRQMLDLDWTELFSNCTENVNQQWDIFITKYQEAEKTCIPRKIIRTKNRRYSVPLDRKTLAKKRKKYRLWKRYLEKEDGKIYSEYRRCSNQLRRLTRKATKIYEKNISLQAKNNPKVFWKFVGSKTKMKSKIPDLYTTEDEDPDMMTGSDQEKAETLGKIFSSVFTNEPEGTWEFLDKPEIRHSLNINITEDKLLKKLQKLKISKSAGPDGVHPRVLNELQVVIAKPLTMIFCTSVNTGTLPQAWKEANISAIFKKGC